MKKDTNAQGAAAVHLVCADLLLQGFHAYVAAEGLHYDVVIDVEGRLLRMQVKSTRFMRGRAGRPDVLRAYQFLTNRGHRPDVPGGKSSPKRYSPDHADLMACVALDVRLIAYLRVSARMQTAIYFYPPGTPGFARGGKVQRRCIDKFPIADALKEHGWRGPPQMGWL